MDLNLKYYEQERMQNLIIIRLVLIKINCIELFDPCATGCILNRWQQVIAPIITASLHALHTMKYSPIFCFILPFY